MIYCIFYIAIINSIKEYGQLRTVGMTGKQIKRLVFREGFLLSLIAIPAGLVSGTLLSYLLIPQGFQIANLLWIWPIVAVLIYLTVRFSIRKPAMIAATVSPIDAYHYTGSHSGTGKLSLRLQKISPSMLAKKHILSNKRKHVLTITSLVLTGALLLGLSSVLSSVNEKEMSLSGFPRGQLIVNISNEELRNNSLEQIQTTNPLTNDLRDSLSSISGMEYITEYHYLPVSAEQEAEESDAAIVSFNREDMALIRSCAADESIPDYDELTERSQIIIGRPNDLPEYMNIQAEIGQTISLKIFDGTASYIMDFQVGAILDQSKIGNNGDKIDMLMLPLDVMDRIASCNTAYQYAVSVSDEFEEQAEMELEQILKGTPELSITTLSATIAQNENFMQAMKLALFVAVTFIGCFAVMNIVNTTLTGIITRQKEFALMRSVGMSQKQLSSMVRCESLIIIIIGLLLSLLIGGGIGGILCFILKSSLMSYLNYHFPLGIAASYCVIVFLCTLFVTGAALRHQNRYSLIEQIRK